ncbi:hypothetical protein BC792_1346 [Sphingobacterium allocomposti]|uniref:Uncharacterized protein n=1 Tax=Sphingobacterium allocomposti TaxID=415956 RepID=A0A5S5CXD2_9SPHI|nr:hypothetical protein BC792_1346 [Sphingobacterium composti Yoo et al. 2007 non Ten et al. 2007]
MLFALYCAKFPGSRLAPVGGGCRKFYLPIVKGGRICQSGEIGDPARVIFKYISKTTIDGQNVPFGYLEIQN